MPPMSLMIKPVSGLCNLRCRYCFYEDVAKNRAQKSLGVMDLNTLEVLIRRAFAYADQQISFAFQGGEPTLAGIDFYRAAVRLQRKYNGRGLTVHNAIQTNGFALTDELCAFFAAEKFLIGVSLDGDRETHNGMRMDAAGHGTYDAVVAGIDKLKQHGADVNILTVVTEQVARRGAEVFDALAHYGYLQFIPCIDGFGEPPGPHSLTAESYGQFMIDTFDRYARALRRGQPVSVRNLDNLLQMVRGVPPEHCGMRGTCGRYFLLEADGSCYPCDFYVIDDWRMGSVKEKSFQSLAKSEVAERFVRMSHPVAEGCSGCPYFRLCRGGCRRDREPFMGDGPSQNRLCAGYKLFFSARWDDIHRLAEEVFKQ